MKPSLILEHIAADGLTLSISEDGNLDISGDESAVNDWLEVIKENKAVILAELRTQRALQELAGERKYAILVTDASTDPVLVKVSVRGIGTFDMEIPKANYDGLALLEVVEQHSLEAEKKTGSNVYLLPDNRSAA